MIGGGGRKLESTNSFCDDVFEPCKSVDIDLRRSGNVVSCRHERQRRAAEMRTDCLDPEKP